MDSTHKQFKARAVSRVNVKNEYDSLDDEFAFVDQVLSARAESGLTQAEVAERVGTTQSVIARLESGRGKHSPSITTLHKYAKAMGYRLEVRFVKLKNARTVSRKNA